MQREIARSGKYGAGRMKGTQINHSRGLNFILSTVSYRTIKLSIPLSALYCFRSPRVCDVHASSAHIYNNMCSGNSRVCIFRNNCTYCRRSKPPPALSSYCSNALLYIHKHCAPNCAAIFLKYLTYICAKCKTFALEPFSDQLF
jgi:hypothetical protein